MYQSLVETGRQYPDLRQQIRDCINTTQADNIRIQISSTIIDTKSVKALLWFLDERVKIIKEVDNEGVLKRVQQRKCSEEVMG